MQDRLKFRIWNNIRKSYIDFSAQDTAQLFLDINEPCLYMRDLDDEILYLHDFSNDNFIMEQCTGLKDKNGNLIYEGDIVKIGNGTINAVVMEYEKVVKWLAEGGWNLPTWAHDKTDWSHYVEIIGNIHTTEKE